MSPISGGLHSGRVKRWQRPCASAEQQFVSAKEREPKVSNQVCCTFIFMALETEDDVKAKACGDAFIRARVLSLREPERE